VGETYLGPEDLHGCGVQRHVRRGCERPGSHKTSPCVRPPGQCCAGAHPLVPATCRLQAQDVSTAVTRPPAQRLCRPTSQKCPKNGHCPVAGYRIDFYFAMQSSWRWRMEQLRAAGSPRVRVRTTIRLFAFRQTSRSGARSAGGGSNHRQCSLAWEIAIAHFIRRRLRSSEQPEPGRYSCEYQP
jgi:hypothetical protein